MPDHIPDQLPDEIDNAIWSREDMGPFEAALLGYRYGRAEANAEIDRLLAEIAAMKSAKEAGE